MKVNEIVVHENIENSHLYKAGEQAFTILTQAKKSFGHPSTLQQEDALHRYILDYLGL